MVQIRPEPQREAGVRERCDLVRFCCALCGADGPTARRLFDERRDVDWRALVALAFKYRLDALLHHAVEAHLADRVDAETLQALRKRRGDLQAWSDAASAQLVHVLDLLAAAQVPALAFKGPVFGLQLYGDPALRTFADLDVLIPEAGVERATRALLDEGYTAGLRLDWELSFVRAGGLEVDLHWSLREPIHQFPRSTDELLARGTTVLLAGAQVPALRAEDIVLALCFNGLAEDWQRFDRIAEIVAFLRRHPDFDWEALLALARQHGCERIVLVALHLAKELFRAPLPAAAEPRLRAHRRAIARAGFAVDDYLRFALTATDRRRGYDAQRFLWRMRERLRDKVPYIETVAYGLFTQKDADSPWRRALRQVLYTVLRLPLIGARRGIRFLTHAGVKAPGRH